MAEEEHDLFITPDQNLRYQENLRVCKIAILELYTKDWNTLREHIPDIIASVGSIKSGEFVRSKSALLTSSINYLSPNSAAVSIEAVCGNMSTGTARVSV